MPNSNDYMAEYMRKKRESDGGASNRKAVAEYYERNKEIKKAKAKMYYQLKKMKKLGLDT
jgi:hypothetical protein